jgi:hypothetical protein
MAVPSNGHRVLILFAHPALHRSRVNRGLVRAVRDLEDVTFHDLYEAYPDFDARVLKGELVDRVANFDPRLITEKHLDLAVACDRSVRYVQGAGTEFASPRAFYAAVA